MSNTKLKPLKVYTYYIYTLKKTTKKERKKRAPRIEIKTFKKI